MISIREWLYIGLIVGCLTIGTGAWLSYRHALIEKGRSECQAQVQRAIEQQRAVADENAAIYQAQSDKTRIEYRTRVKEVTKYVPTNHTCDLPANTVRMLNNAITGANPPATR